mgnify:CR=1 FL=1
MTSLLIKNGLIIHSQSQGSEDILIQGEFIQAVGPGLDAPEDCDIIDAKGKWIFPGVIDPHTHMGIPIKSGNSVDTFASGSRSALHGGVTSILDFSVLEQGQTLSESLDRRIALAREAVCDVGIHINITRFSPEILVEIPHLISRGFTSFKVFTTYEASGMMLTYDQIEVVARIIATHGGVLMVHAEDNETILTASKQYMESGETHPRFHGMSRPPEAELIAVRHLGEISDRTGCLIYIVHLNTSEGLALATSFPRLRVETCPHYLLLTEESYEHEDGRMYVASPPLRSNSDCESLWRGLILGQIHTIGSDHCPFCKSDKPASTLFQDIANGMGGVETLFPVLLAEFVKRDLDLSLLVRLTSGNAARIFGIHKYKGNIATGSHADLIILDSKVVTQDWYENLDSILDWNAYTGMPAIFPRIVIRRGEIVVSEGSITSPSRGKIIKAVVGHS